MHQNKKPLEHLLIVLLKTLCNPRMKKKSWKIEKNMQSTNPPDLERIRPIYIKARTFVDDEQFYFGTFGILFFSISIWALSSRFKPVDTVVVFLVFSLILLLYVAVRWSARSKVKRKTIESHFKSELWKAEPQKGDPPNEYKYGYYFLQKAWYIIFDKHNKPWEEFKVLMHKSQNGPMSNADWDKLEELNKEDKNLNKTVHKLGAYGGALAVLGTILRLHGTSKESNTSGTILVLLYEIVFTLYCTWQLLFEEHNDALNQCHEGSSKNYYSLSKTIRPMMDTNNFMYTTTPDTYGTNTFLSNGF
jgi:hypothetical protein